MRRSCLGLSLEMYLVACKAQNREGLTHPKCLPHGNTRQGKKRQLKFSCLVICYCDASLAPISFATLYVLRILLASLVIGTFLQLKEMIGKGTKYFALSTSSRISITSAGVLSLSIVICASRLSPPAVAMARLGNDVHMLHVKIYLYHKLHMSHIIRSIACDELDEHVYE